MKLEINSSLLLFLLIAMIAVVNDVILYITKINVYPVTLLISTVIVIFLMFFFIKKNKIKIINNFSKEDFIFLVPFFIGCFFMAQSCDYGFDTINYHIYLQENFFSDKVNFDFYPGNIVNSFLFPLGDRMHYIFRYFFGYRYGTILSFYTLVVLFYQTKKIIEAVFPKMKEKDIIFFILSMIPCFLIITVDLIGSYYIDNFSFIFLVEMVYIFIKEDNIFENKIYLYYLSLLLGIGTAVKISNFILGIIIVIAILLKSIIKHGKLELITNLKKMKIYDILGITLLFIIPFLVYAIDNYKQTGSPIFPIDIPLFHLKYFQDFKWKDERFGVPSILHGIVWPILIVIDNSIGNDNILDYIWGIGYVICISYVIIRPYKYNITWKLSLLALMLTVAWELWMLGYARYAMIIPILYSIVVMFILLEIFFYIPKNIIQKCLRYVGMICFVMVLFLTFAYGINYEKNKIVLSVLLKNDKKYLDESSIYEIDGVWGRIDGNTGMLNMIRDPKTPIYNLDKEHFENSGIDMNTYYEKIKNQKIYTIFNLRRLPFYMEQLLKNNFYPVNISKIYYNYKMQNKDDEWLIFELKYIE